MVNLSVPLFDALGNVIAALTCPYTGRLDVADAPGEDEVLALLRARRHGHQRPPSHRGIVTGGLRCGSSTPTFTSSTRIAFPIRGSPRRRRSTGNWTADAYFAAAEALGIEAALHMEVDVVETDMEAETRFVLRRAPAHRRRHRRGATGKPWLCRPSRAHPRHRRHQGRPACPAPVARRTERHGALCRKRPAPRRGRPRLRPLRPRPAIADRPRPRREVSRHPVRPRSLRRAGHRRQGSRPLARRHPQTRRNLPMLRPRFPALSPMPGRIGPSTTCGPMSSTSSLRSAGIVSSGVRTIPSAP